MGLAVARNTALLRFDEGEWVDVQARGQFGNAPDFFARDMAVYVHGFGDPAAEFWLGLDELQQLTREGAQLRIELETFDGETVQATYSTFRVEGSDYRLTVAMQEIPLGSTTGWLSQRETTTKTGGRATAPQPEATVDGGSTVVGLLISMGSTCQVEPLGTRASSGTSTPRTTEASDRAE